MQQQIVWTIGDWRQPDFAAPLACVKTHASCEAFSAVTEACKSSGRGPAAVLFVQARPGQISRRDVERMHAAVPLARLVGLLGPWCEGELRSGQPWPGVVRVPWRAWRTRLLQELGLEFPAAGIRLPRTAADTERLTSSLARLRERTHSDITAEICSARRAELESLRDALQRLGLNVIWRHPEHGGTQTPADVVLIDGWENVAASSPASPPRVLVLHFPRPDDVERAAAAKIAAIVGRPLLLADLAATLDAVLPNTALSHESAA